MDIGNKAGSVSRRQKNALIFVSLLSPIIRLFPKSAVSIGGKAVWFSPLLALPLVLLIFAMMQRFLKNAGPEEGLGDMIIKAAGKVAGKIMLTLIAFWLVFYTGFIVKSSAERLLSSIYPNGQPAMFVVTTVLVAAWMASGKLRSLGRTAEIFAGVIGVIILIIILVAGFSIKAKNLLPITVKDAGGIAIGAIPVANVLGIGSYMAFLSGSEKTAKKNFGAVLLLVIVIMAIMVTTIGNLGTEIINSLQHSFFVMVRDIDLIGVTERIEAAVIISWVITDILYVTVLLKICGEIGGTIIKKEKKKKYIFAAAVFSIIIALFVIKNAFILHFISGIIIPIINILVVFILFPLLFVVGRIRQKI